MNDVAENRAEQALRCLPFRLRFFQELRHTAISGKELANRKDWEQLVFVPFSAERAEDHFSWLIKIGVLRREVDGQGLTNRVRLTPLGEKVVGQWKDEIPRAGLREKIYENFRRHSTW